MASNHIEVLRKNGQMQVVRGTDNSLSTIDHTHRKNHDGKLYRAPYFKTVAASSWATMWLTSASTSMEVHTYFQLTADNSGTLEIFKGTVSATSQWASITPINANGWSTNASATVVYSGGVPTTSTATLYFVSTVGSGGKTALGGGGGITDEIILVPGSTYCVKYTCTSTEADAAFDIMFYEES